MKFVNLTGKMVVVNNQNIQPSGVIAEVEVKREYMEEDDGSFSCETTYGEIRGLPSPEDGTVYIINSILIFSMLKNARTDVWVVSNRSGRQCFIKSAGK